MTNLSLSLFLSLSLSLCVSHLIPANATYFKSSSNLVTGCCVQNEANLHLYLKQIGAGPNPNQVIPVNSVLKNSFGMIAINDWDILEGPDPGSKVVARAQGIHVQCGQNKARWFVNFNMLFEDDRFNGSTLEVRGAWEPPFPVEWAIVGGTGEFTLAQGILSGTDLSVDGTRRILELFIHVFYCAIGKPEMV
ncbi:pterocarpan synthase 1-like [Carex rostrata]